MNEVVTRSADQNLPTLDPMIQSYVPRELALVKLGQPPETIAEAIYWARTLSMSGLLPESLRDRRTQQIKVADVVLLIAYGAELGLSPLMAINAIYIVKGRPMISAQLWAERIRKHGHQLVVTVTKDPDGNPQSATAHIVRGDDKTEHEVTFTIHDAQRAGLGTVRDGRIVSQTSDGKPQPWQAWTERMLVCRASSHCGRLGAPDAILGYGIQGEEFTNELDPDDGFDQFIAQRSVTGLAPAATTPLEDQASELEALATRYEEQKQADKLALGAILKGVKERVEQPGAAVPRTGDQEQLWEDHVEAENQLADDEEDKAERQRRGRPLKQLPDEEATCEICGMFMIKTAHDITFDHAPVWLVEPKDE